MKRYRIKRPDGRVIGPVILSDISELVKANEIQETDLFQLFPIGDWEEVSNIPDIKKVFKEILKAEESSGNEEATTNNTPISSSNDPNFREFTFDRKEDEVVDYKELEEKYKEIEEEKKKQRKKREEKEAELQKKIEENLAKSEDEDEMEKTVVVSRSSLKKDTIEKTVVVNREDLAGIEEEALAVDEDEKKDVEDKKEEVVEEEVFDEDGATKMFDPKELLVKSEEKEEVVVEDTIDLEKEIANIEFKNKKAQNRKKKKKEAQKKKESEAVTTKKKSLVVVLALAALFFLILPDEKKKEVKIGRPKFIFPVVEKYEDKKKSKELYQQGLLSYAKGTYSGKVLAADFFRKSLKQSFRKNPAIYDLILVYSELLNDVGDNIEAGLVLNRLLAITRSKVYSNYKVALGSANYYSFFGKKATATNVLNSYLRLNKPNPKLYAKVLKLNLETGDYVSAEARYKKLKTAKIRNVEVLNALIDYQVQNEDIEGAIELAKKESTKFKNNYVFLAKYCSLLLKVENFAQLEKIANSILATKADGSPYIYSQGLKYRGYVEIARGNMKLVPRYFNESLKYYDSEELKDVLSNLEVAGSELSQKIIIKSKIEVLISKAKIAMKKYEWKDAFEYAIEATELDGKNIQASLLLAEIQRKRGFFNQAISTLEKLRDKYPLNKDINKELVMANINAYKRIEARRLLSSLSTIPNFKNTYEYNFLLGHYYKMTGNDKSAYKKFQTALKKNPLNDKLYYEMAVIAFSKNSFKKCKSFLNNALKLDPLNTDYKVLYSKVLFEMDGLDTANGYLRGELKKHQDDPKIIGQMAVFYYRDQEIAQYKEYRERLERLRVKDESLYRYVLEASLVEKDDKEVVRNGEKLLIINPGDLETRITLAQAYVRLGNDNKALEHLEEIDKKMPAYPRVNFYKAQILLSSNKLKEAEEAGKKEIELNKSEYGYYILGEVYLKQKEYVEARKMLEKSIQLRPDFYECLLALGWLKYKQGYYPTARELYLRASRQREGDPEVHRRLGYVFKEIGQGQMAIDKFKMYLNLNPVAKDREEIKRIILQLQ